MLPSRWFRKPKWLWTSINAGMTVLPVRFTRVAPGGAWICPFLPTLVKRSFSIMKAELSMGAPPSPMMSRAPSNNVIFLGCCASTTKEKPSRQNKTRLIERTPPKLRKDVCREFYSRRHRLCYKFAARLGKALLAANPRLYTSSTTPERSDETQNIDVRTSDLFCSCDLSAALRHHQCCSVDQRRHKYGGGTVAGWKDARHRFARSAVDCSSHWGHRASDHGRFCRCAPTCLVTRWKSDRVPVLSRWRMAYLVGPPRRVELETDDGRSFRGP